MIAFQSLVVVVVTLAVCARGGVLDKWKLLKDAKDGGGGPGGPPEEVHLESPHLYRLEPFASIRSQNPHVMDKKKEEKEEVKARRMDILQDDVRAALKKKMAGAKRRSRRQDNDGGGGGKGPLSVEEALRMMERLAQRPSKDEGGAKDGNGERKRIKSELADEKKDVGTPPREEKEKRTRARILSDPEFLTEVLKKQLEREEEKPPRDPAAGAGPDANVPFYFQMSGGVVRGEISGRELGKKIESAIIPAISKMVDNANANNNKDKDEEEDRKEVEISPVVSAKVVSGGDKKDTDKTAGEAFDYTYTDTAIDEVFSDLSPPEDRTAFAALAKMSARVLTLLGPGFLSEVSDEVRVRMGEHTIALAKEALHSLAEGNVGAAAVLKGMAEFVFLGKTEGGNNNIKPKSSVFFGRNKVEAQHLSNAVKMLMSLNRTSGFWAQLVDDEAEGGRRQMLFKYLGRLFEAADAKVVARWIVESKLLQLMVGKERETGEGASSMAVDMMKVWTRYLPAMTEEEIQKGVEVEGLVINMLTTKKGENEQEEKELLARLSSLREIFFRLISKASLEQLVAILETRHYSSDDSAQQMLEEASVAEEEGIAREQAEAAPAVTADGPKDGPVPEGGLVPKGGALARGGGGFGLKDALVPKYVPAPKGGGLVPADEVDGGAAGHR